MGKGDRKTKRFKIWRGTNGKTRLRKKERLRKLRRNPVQLQAAPSEKNK